ncbi:MAG TPA: GYF domain-containing protein [Myxococcota bacterium]|nr:GYF domain-containing protein [Myxococcota bacterium]HQK51590.1 GYF domain-containing protein [Myxococcota bacterium]
MKVRCPNCSASYKLPAEKIRGTGTVKVRCKKCGQVIEVQPEADSESSQEAGLPEARLTQSSPAIQVGTDGSSGETSAGTVAQDAPVSFKWYLASGGERLGPFTMEEVKGRLASKEATLQTLAWRKGLADWTPLGEFEEFRGALHSFDEDGGETQLMDVARLRSQPSGPAVEPPREQDAAGDGGLVWQRRETSVLFSVDDYKMRKGTRGVAAVPLVEVPPASRVVEPLETKAAVPQPSVVAPRITLDEAEVRQVAEALARRRRRRRNLLTGLGIGVGVVVIAGAVWAWRSLAPVPEPAPVAVEPPRPTPPPAPDPVPKASEPAAAPAPAPAPAPEESPRKEAAPAPAKAHAPRETAGKADGKGTARPSSPAPAAEQKPAAPTKPPARQEEDANALLAALSQGRERPGTQGSGGGAPKPAAASEDSSLPLQLSSAQISSVLRKKQTALQQCIRAAGLPLPFRATARITISNSGSVTGVNGSETKGASGCVEATLRSAVFPPFRGDVMTVPVTIAVE